MHSLRLALQHLPGSHGGRRDLICSLQRSLAYVFHMLAGSLRAQLCSPRTFQKRIWTALLTGGTLCRRFHFVMLCTFLEAMSAPQSWVDVMENIILFLCTESFKNHCLQHWLSVSSRHLIYKHTLPLQKCKSKHKGLHVLMKIFFFYLGNPDCARLTCQHYSRYLLETE